MATSFGASPHGPRGAAMSGPSVNMVRRTVGPPSAASKRCVGPPSKRRVGPPSTRQKPMLKQEDTIQAVEDSTVPDSTHTGYSTGVANETQTAALDEVLR